MMSNNKIESGNSKVVYSEKIDVTDSLSKARRQALVRIATNAAFVAPATLALLSTEAKACSLTC